MSFTYRLVETEEDFAQAHDMVSDWEVVRQLSHWPWPSDPDYTRTRLMGELPEGSIVTAVYDGATLVGTGGIVAGRWGLMVPRAHWRRGVATAIADYLFPRYFAGDATSLIADVWEDNAASRALHARLGFVETSRDHKPNLATGTEMPSVNYVLTRDAWEARR